MSHDTPQSPSDSRFHLIVVGNGAVATATAIAAAEHGARVALCRFASRASALEQSMAVFQALRSAASAFAATQRSSALSEHPMPDFPAVVDRALLAWRENEQRTQSHVQTLKVMVSHDNPTFASRSVIMAGSRTLSFSRAAIEAESHPVSPLIEGIKNSHYRSYEDWYEMKSLPTRLGILGAGRFGVELAQSYARLGSAVTVYEKLPRILPREDAHDAQLVQLALESEGVKFRLGCTSERIVQSGDMDLVSGSSAGTAYEDRHDELLVACGQRIVPDSLNPAAAGIEWDEAGFRANDRLYTTNPRVLSLSPFPEDRRYAYAADVISRMVTANGLFFGRTLLSELRLPICTLTNPGIAHAGLRTIPSHAKKLKLLTIDSASNPALFQGERASVRVIHNSSGQILGVTAVSTHAREIVAAFLMAMNQRIRLSALTTIIMPTSDPARVLQTAGDTFRHSLVTPFVRSLLNRILDWRS